MTSPDPVVIAIDCSTTASKAVVFDLTGATICESRRPLALSNPGLGRYEQDATEWWEATADALTSVTGLLDHRSHEPVALTITHQRESFVCVDRDWHPIRPAILWLDSRASAQITRLGTPGVHQLTGKAPSAIPSYYKIAWLHDNEPGTLTRTHQVLDVHAYLAHQLTGRALSPTASADALGLIDLATQNWSPTLTSACGLNSSQLAELGRSGQTIGTLHASVARRTGLPADLPVIAGAGDGQCAGLGVAAVTPGTAYLNLGTSLSLGVFVDGHPIYPGLRTLISPLPGRSCVETLLPVGGVALTWLRHAIGAAVNDPALENAAAHVPAGARGLHYFAHLHGPDTRLDQPDQSGAFVGLQPDHGPAELMRAVIEGLAFDQLECLNYLQRHVGDRINQLIVTGGISQSALVTQIFANVLPVPLVVAPERESTALGVAMVAAAAYPGSTFASVDDAVHQMATPEVPIQPWTQEVARYQTVAAARRSVVASLDPDADDLVRLDSSGWKTQ